jgi:adenylosuccinate synthase
MCSSVTARTFVLPYHRALDEQRELRKDGSKIGTTKRGIGPAYGDKAARTGLRMADLMQPALFTEKLRAKMQENNSILKALGARSISFAKVNADFLAAGERLKPFVAIRSFICIGRCSRERKSSSKARREHFLTSITELIPMSRRPTPPRVAPAPAPACRRTGWIASSV